MSDLIKDLRELRLSYQKGELHEDRVETHPHAQFLLWFNHALEAQLHDPYAVPALVAEFDKAEQQLKGRGRLLIRKSGTEPVIRVMVEGDDLDEVNTLANTLADAVRANAA